MNVQLQQLILRAKFKLETLQAKDPNSVPAEFESLILYLDDMAEHERMTSALFGPQ